VSSLRLFNEKQRQMRTTGFPDRADRIYSTGMFNRSSGEAQEVPIPQVNGFISTAGVGRGIAEATNDHMGRL
jgi:hypothetical protein